MNNRLKFFFFPAFCVFVLFSCGKDNESQVNPPQSPEIVISVPDVTLPDVISGSTTVTFTTTAPWILELSDTKAAPDWFDVSPKSGGGGSVTLTITILKNNEEYDDRSAYIKIKSGELVKSMTVTQKKKDALLLTKDRYDIPPEGGDFSVEVKSNIDYQVSIDEGCNGWISKGAKSKGLSIRSESFNVSSGSMDGSREGLIIFSSGSFKDTVHVYQGQQNGLILTTKSKNIDAAAQSFDVELKSNVEYNVSFINGNWLRRAQTKLMRVDRLSFAADENTGYDNRTLQVVFKDKNSLLADTLTVTQAQKNALILSQKSCSLDEAGGEIDVELKSNVDYEIVMPTDISWIIRIETKSLNTYNHKFKVLSNTEPDSRSVKVIFKDKASELSDTLYIKQNKKGALLFTDHTMKLSPFAVDTFAVIASNLTYELVTNPKDTTWMKISTLPFTKAIKEDKLYLRVKSNLNLNHRHGQVIIKEPGGNKTDTLFVTQQGFSSYDKPLLWLEDDTVVVSSDGAEVVAKLWANIAYNKIITEQWLTSAETTKGLALFNEKFKVVPNPSKIERKATVRFESKNNPALFTVFTILQQANTKSIHPDSLVLVRIYNEAGGVNWKTKWDLTKPINTWKGVTLTKVETGERRVTGLDLSQLGISGKVNINGLTYLKKLNILWNKNISHIKADSLEFLTNLEAGGNQISKIELSCLPALKSLDLSGNNLTSFIVTNKDLPNLTTLSLNYNNLVALSIKDLEQLTNLSLASDWQLKNNPIEDMDISGCKSLTSFSGGISNSIKTFKAVGCTKLIGNATFGLTFSNHNDWSPCYHNLISVDVSGCESIPAIYFSNPKLERVNLDGCTSLEKITITTAHLKTLNISGLVKLKYVGITNMESPDFRITGNNLPLLADIYCGQGNMASLSVAVDYTGRLSCNSNPALATLVVKNSLRVTTLECYSNPMLQELDLTGMKELVTLNVFPHKLKKLNISQCSKLSTIYYTVGAILESFIAVDCKSLVMLDFRDANPALKEVDVTNCTSLSSMFFENVSLEKLNVKNCISLTKLQLVKTTLPTLDVSTLTSLKDLSCIENTLLTSILGIQECNSIERITCWKNSQLTGNVILKDMKNLQQLNLTENAFSSIDISGMPKLFILNVGYNKMSSMSFRDLPIVKRINCSANQAKTITVNSCLALENIESSEPCRVVNCTNCPVLIESITWTPIIGYDANNKPIYDYLPKYYK